MTTENVNTLESIGVRMFDPQRNNESINPQPMDLF